jgi:hypothetical protein
MPVTIPLEPNEQLIYQNTFQGERQAIPFVFAASRSAIFVSREKHFAMEPWCFVRVPLNRIRRVLLRKERPLALWLTAGLIFAFGLALSVMMIINNFSSQRTHTIMSGLPFLITIFGAAMPFLAKNRQTLVVEMDNEQYKWKPKMQFDKNKREKIERLQDEILEVCHSIGIRVARDDAAVQ